MRDLDWSDVVADGEAAATPTYPAKASTDKFLIGLVEDVFARHKWLGDAKLIAELAGLIEQLSEETADMAIANVTDPSCPAYGLGVRG